MTFWIFVSLAGWLLPVLLLWWRFKREPRWAMVLRYLLAVAVVWSVLLALAVFRSDELVAVADATNDIAGSTRDAGLNAVALFLGWIPGVCYATLLWLLQAAWLWATRRRLSARTA